jgi:phosphoribosyl-AMP cyclohydrolase
MTQPDFDKSNLLPAIVQDEKSGRVLMLAYINAEAYKLTLETGFCHFWSRSRNEIWKKGGTSGNLLLVSKIELDCDSDSILIHAKPAGPTCHNGTESCFDTHGVELFDKDSTL